MEIIESILWLSVGLLPTLATLEVAWKVSKAPAVKVPMAARERKMEVKMTRV